MQRNGPTSGRTKRRRNVLFLGGGGSGVFSCGKQIETAEGMTKLGSVINSARSVGLAVGMKGDGGEERRLMMPRVIRISSIDRLVCVCAPAGCLAVMVTQWGSHVVGLVDSSLRLSDDGRPG